MILLIIEKIREPFSRTTMRRGDSVTGGGVPRVIRVPLPSPVGKKARAAWMNNIVIRKTNKKSLSTKRMWQTSTCVPKTLKGNNLCETSDNGERLLFQTDNMLCFLCARRSDLRLDNVLFIFCFQWCDPEHSEESSQLNFAVANGCGSQLLKQLVR